MPAQNEYDMLMMQQNAQRRVREMRNRARSAAMAQDELAPPPPLNRNWSSATGRSRRFPSQPLRPSAPSAAPRPERETAHVPPPPPPPTPEQSAPPPNAKTSDGTVLGDVMGALGLEEDTLLIIGLLLILINQKADTTLLLALAYLLI